MILHPSDTIVDPDGNVGTILQRFGDAYEVEWREDGEITMEVLTNIFHDEANVYAVVIA